MSRHTKKMVCRECGCTADRPCVLMVEGKPTIACYWVEPNLCAACEPEATHGWIHPSPQSRPRVSLALEALRRLGGRR